MKLIIKTSGGIGGFGLQPQPTPVDVAELPPALAQRARAAFAKGRLAKLAGARGSPHAADMIGYAITVVHDDGAREHAAMREDALPQEMLELIDAIREAKR